ncbi:hypothetical protein CHITON_0538 [Thermococcus chitonophagus]|uniref:Uncharacterized protein n=1 Tax=Thermococcus chitonophagus TaxID=54262 RepID=A0A160VR00_9EURY|nr:hypothetical protein CHITON_0538 [Thermococcus chitonophagus]
MRKLGHQKPKKVEPLISLILDKTLVKWCIFSIIFHPMTPRGFIDVLDAYHELYPEIKRPVVIDPIEIS